MATTHPIRRIFSRFFPKKYTAHAGGSEQWMDLPSEQKKDLAIRYLAQGELALLQGNLNALSLFEAASQLDPENPNIWHRQGLAFFEYGSEEGQEKALLVASKYFKYATQISPSFFNAWIAWGNTLLQLGRFHNEHHFLIEAKEKYQKALKLSSTQSTEILAELYWDYGIAWLEISRHSGEALDLKLSIDAFKQSLKLDPMPPAEFFNDFGKACLELGLLINDPGLYFQAIETLKHSIAHSPQYFDGWASLAESYSQLYINTMDERYVAKACQAYEQAIKIMPKNAEIWLSWSQILAEAGRLKGDVKMLHQSIEKCARASTLDPKEPLITAQWVEALSLLGFSTGRIDLLTEAEQKIIKATEAFPDDPDLWHAYGICLLCLGRYYEEPEYFEMAIEKLQWGLSIDRTSAEHWHSLALVHKYYADFIQHEDLLERANRFFARAIDLKPSCPSLLFDAACSLLRFSEMTQDLPSLQQALAHFETLMQNHKEIVLHHPEWLFEYACGLQWLGELGTDEPCLARAIDIFSHVLLIDPDFPHIHHRIASTYVALGHQTGESESYKKAIPFFRLASRQDEENDQLWLDWGLCLIDLAHHTLDGELMHQLYWDAEQKITQAGTLGNTSAYYNLACLYSILGRTAESMELIQKSLNVRALPTIEEMIEDEWLENLRSTEAFVQFLNDLENKIQTREQ